LPRYRTVMFDLDGTLLGLDLDYFFQRYFEAIGRHFAALVPAEQLVRRIMAATQAMMLNPDPAVTNREAFCAAFFDGDGRAFGLERDDMMQRFHRFYLEEFPALREDTRPVAAARPVLEALSAAGRRLVLATNPMFPLAAIEERLRWGGLEGSQFDLITAYETMHFCKPHPGYYREILEITGDEPGDCLMVGNDERQDLAAGLVGIATFLVEDYCIRRPDDGFVPDFCGRLEDVPAVVGV